MCYEATVRYVEAIEKGERRREMNHEIHESGETLADIVAALRQEAEDSPYIERAMIYNRYADRIEAAAKRDEDSRGDAKARRVGNMAKLREALVAAKKFVDSVGEAALGGEVDAVTICQCAANLLARIDAILANPPRNCDVGTAEEQAERFDKFCHVNINTQRCCGDCPAFHTTHTDCELVWAQMPYKEGDIDKQ